MPNITPESVKAALGDAWSPDGDYVIGRHSNAFGFTAKGYRLVGKIPDATSNDQGTMLIFDRNPRQGG